MEAGLSEDRRTVRARQQREQRRLQLLEAGLTVFAARGYHATGVADIIEEAGVARGTFYLYFESKRALFDAVLDEQLAAVEEGIHRVDVSPGATPALDQLRANVRWLLQLPETRPRLVQLFLWEAVGLDEKTDAKLDSFHQRIFALTRRSLVLGTALGLVRECDPDIVARALVGMVKEVMVSLTVRKDLPEPDVDRLADEILDLATGGVLRLE
ncbi:MAG: helix-turn-helix transcriptional regulator [Deltaproteobacteria bacterium]|nr:helix-turn-helix transcriptional regulator [Deltaproteobacteria bacterium]